MQSEELQEHPAGVPVSQAPVRGTQSFVHTLSWCWRRPTLTALEVLWRWAFGVPALYIFWRCWQHVVTATQFDINTVTGLTVTEPMATAAGLSESAAVLWPPTWNIARWLVPLMMLAWIVVSTLGRTVVLRRVDARLQSRPGTVMLLSAIRVLALCGSFVLWFGGMHWAALIAVVAPLTRGAEPNLVLYFALVIVGTLVLFVLWAAVSWVFGAAPLLAMLRGYGPGKSIAATLHLGALKGKLVEINLVMGIVKIALIVLALVISACPLPFTDVATPEFMFWWYLGTTVFYLLASDFFHVARLAAYLDLWHEYED